VKRSMCCDYSKQLFTSFKWTDECQNAFDELKTFLTSTPILAYPLPDIPFILDTDASDKAVGAVLSQVQDSHERVMASPMCYCQVICS
jgi:hypothetical protein